MKFYVAAILEKDIICILDAYNEIVEFTKREVGLLDLFVDIVGYDRASNFVEIAVYSYCTVSGTCCMLKAAFVNREYAMTKWQVTNKRELGYLIPPDDVFKFDYYNISIAMRYGIRAAVTDMGRLIYLDPVFKSRIVLGDLCTSIIENAITSADNTVFVFDDRIESCSRYAYVRGILRGDTSRVTGKNRKFFDSLISSGFFVEVAS